MFWTIELYLCKTELFEIELFIYKKKKEDLALNNQQRLKYHKTQTNKRVRARARVCNRFGVKQFQIHFQLSWLR